MSALTDYFTSLANKIRSKTGKNGTLTPTDMVDEVDAVYAAGAASVPTPTSQSKSVTPSTSAQTVTPDSGYDYLSQVSVGAIQTQTKSATPSTTAQTITPDSDKFLSSVSVSAIQTQEKTANAYQSYGSVLTVTPDSGKYLSKVNIPKFLGGNLNGFNSNQDGSVSGSAGRTINFSSAGIWLLVVPINPGTENDAVGITSVSNGSVLKQTCYKNVCSNGTVRFYSIIVSANSSSSNIRLSLMGAAVWSTYSSIVIKLADL